MPQIGSHSWVFLHLTPHIQSIHQQIQLVPHSKQTQNLTTSHHLTAVTVVQDTTISFLGYCKYPLTSFPAITLVTSSQPRLLVVPWPSQAHFCLRTSAFAVLCLGQFIAPDSLMAYYLPHSAVCYNITLSERSLVLTLSEVASPPSFSYIAPYLFVALPLLVIWLPFLLWLFLIHCVFKA